MNGVFKNYIYNVILRRPSYQKELLMLARLFSLPQSEPDLCGLCHCIYLDVIDHLFMNCVALKVEREQLWNTIMNDLDVEASVYLFNLPDNEMFDVFLSNHWIKDNLSVETADTFICNTACFFANTINMLKTNQNTY